MLHKFRLNSFRILLILTSLLLASSYSVVFASDLDVELNARYVKHGEQFIIMVSGGTPNSIITLWISNSMDDIIWADQGIFSSLGKYEYNLTVPDYWEYDEYSISVRDFSEDNVIEESLIITDIIPSDPESKFELSNLIVDPVVAKPEEEVQISVEVTNVGEIYSNYVVELKINDEIMSEKTVMLDVNSSSIVSFSFDTDVIGSYTVKIGNLVEVFDVEEVGNGPFQIPTIVIDLGIISIVIVVIYLLRRTGTI